MATYAENLTTERDNLQAALIAQSAAGVTPDTSDGSRSEQFNGWARDARQRIREINEELARIQPGYRPMPVRGL